MTEPVDTAAVRAALTEFRALLFNGNHPLLPPVLGMYVHIGPFVNALTKAMNWDARSAVAYVSTVYQIITLCEDDQPAVAVPVYDALLEMFGGAA